MKAKLILITSAFWLLAFSVWPQVKNWVSPGGQVEVQRVAPFDDSTLAEPREWVEQAIPRLRETTKRLRAAGEAVERLRDKVPSSLQEKHAAQMESLAIHLENAETWIASLDREPLNPLFLSGAIGTLHQARAMLLPWAGLLAPSSPELSEFLQSELHAPEGSDDPVARLIVTLGEVGITREAQVSQLRQMVRP